MSPRQRRYRSRPGGGDGAVYIFFASARNQGPRRGRKRIDAFDPFAPGRIDPLAANQHLMLVHSRDVENTTKAGL